MRWRGGVFVDSFTGERCLRVADQVDMCIYTEYPPADPAVLHDQTSLDTQDGLPIPPVDPFLAIRTLRQVPGLRCRGTR